MSTPRKTTKKETTEPVDFEKSLYQLEHIIEKMEAGSISLESSLQYFEEGINLIKQCQKTLADAQQKVNIVAEKNDD